MPICAVKNCRNRTSRKSKRQNELEKSIKITFHSFPKNKEQRSKWIFNVGLTEAELPKDAFLCSIHFKEESFDRTSPSRVRLKTNAVPYVISDKLEKQCNDSPQPPTSAVAQNDTASTNQCNQDSLQHYRNCSSENLCLLERSPLQQSGAEISNKKFACRRSLTYVEPEELSLNEINNNSLLPDGDVGDPVSLFPRVVHVDKGTSTSPLLSVNTPRKNYMRKQFSETLNAYRHKIRMLKQKNRRKDKKITSLQNIILQLRKKNFLPEEHLTILEDMGKTNKALFNRLLKRASDMSVPRTYPPELRAFALTLHYYSPRAYNYVRAKFHKCLPHARTLTSWYASIKCEPGFISEAFTAIRERVKQTDKKLIGTIVFDEMAIKRHVEYDGQRYCGFTDMGEGIATEEHAVAKEALVFMFVCMNSPWKIPIGYYLINGVSGEQKCNLLQQGIKMLHEVGVRVSSVSFDGAPSNIAMARLLGCRLDNESVKTWFQHPLTSEKIFIFPDICHMLKLVRNTLGDRKCITNRTGEVILWEYLEILNDFQEAEKLNLGNKLRTAHIMFEKHKMKVRLATQLFSKSVADALTICKDDLKLDEFKDSGPTIEFIRMFNDLFDIFNSKNLRQTGFKQALNSGNYDMIEQKLIDCRSYISNLRDTDGQVLIHSNRKMGFLGFIVAIESLLGLYQEVCVKEHLIEYIPTYRINQDHLELFFGCIRSHGGHNNNPTTQQFKSALKKMLINTELKETSSGNCQPLETISILHVTSTTPSEKIINLSTPVTRFMDADDVGEWPTGTHSSGTQ